MQVEILLPVIMLPKDLLNWMYLVSQVVCIRDVHIQNEISSPFIEAMAHDVTLERLFLAEGGCVWCAGNDFLFH